MKESETNARAVRKTCERRRYASSRLNVTYTTTRSGIGCCAPLDSTISLTRAWFRRKSMSVASTLGKRRLLIQTALSADVAKLVHGQRIPATRVSLWIRKQKGVSLDDACDCLDRCTSYGMIRAMLALIAKKKISQCGVEREIAADVSRVSRIGYAASGRRVFDCQSVADAKDACI